MTRIRATLVAVAVVAGLGSGGLVLATPGAPAGAAGTHRAMVVVETGAATYHQVITFGSDSITGIQALQLAGAQPVVYTFAGQGGAVCRLFGVGRDAGPDCLGGADGDNRYWAYFRAPAGTTTFTYSHTGGGATQVHDGDVEGWRFGTGAAPAYAALPPITTTTSAPPPARSGGGGTGTTAAPNGPSPGTGGATVPPPADPQALAAFLAAVATTTTTVPAADAQADGKAATAVRGKRVARAADPAAHRIDDSGGGGGAGSLVLFAVIAVGLVGGGLLLRRSRRRPVP